VDEDDDDPKLSLLQLFLPLSCRSCPSLLCGSCPSPWCSRSAHSMAQQGQDPSTGRRALNAASCRVVPTPVKRHKASRRHAVAWGPACFLVLCHVQFQLCSMQTEFAVDLHMQSCMGRAPARGNGSLLLLEALEAAAAAAAALLAAAADDEDDELPASR
jgi:hypothetical protein